MLVPKVEDTDTLDVSSVRWIIVIEKEATFRSIVGSSQWKTLRLGALILTVWLQHLRDLGISAHVAAG